MTVPATITDPAYIADLCDWATTPHTHEAYHQGHACPYLVVAAKLAGHPDPRDLTAEWRVDLPFLKGKPPMSLNDRRNPFAHSAMVARVKAITRNAVRDADVPVLGHVHVELHYQPRTNVIGDADNLVATLKPCIDALHQPDERSRWTGIVPGDDARYVSWSPPVRHAAIKGHDARTWLILRSSTAAES